jgi:hypothetical protein
VSDSDRAAIRQGDLDPAIARKHAARDAAGGRSRSAVANVMTILLSSKVTRVFTTWSASATSIGAGYCDDVALPHGLKLALLPLFCAGTSAWIRARLTVHSRSWSEESSVSASTPRDPTSRIQAPHRSGMIPIPENGCHARSKSVKPRLWPSPNDPFAMSAVARLRCLSRSHPLSVQLARYLSH